MADTEQLRARIEEQRMGITGTVEQIENRIMPGRIMARRRDSVRRALTDLRDTVLGNDEPDYSGTSALTSAKEGVQHAPQTIRRQARGNPMAAGAVALGAGWLVATVLPRTQEERAMARRVAEARRGCFGREVGGTGVGERPRGARPRCARAGEAHRPGGRLGDA